MREQMMKSAIAFEHIQPLVMARVEEASGCIC